jgi:hypothetical protein
MTINSSFINSHPEEQMNKRMHGNDARKGATDRQASHLVLVERDASQARVCELCNVAHRAANPATDVEHSVSLLHRKLRRKVVPGIGCFCKHVEASVRHMFFGCALYTQLGALKKNVFRITSVLRKNRDGTVYVHDKQSK